MSLEVKNLGFYYQKNNWIIKDVNLTVDQGEIVGIVAPSGYGKTTLGKIIAGYIKPVTGEVLLNGKNISETKGFNPIQMAHQHPEKSINIRWKINKILNEGWEVSKDIKDKFGIKEDWLNRWPTELSGGELQRICLSRILSPNTQFLIADEITTMIDAITQVQLCNVLMDLSKKQNLGILFITHNKYLIEKVSDRVLNLKELNKR